MNFNITIDLDWPSYEDDINNAIKETVLDEVRKEVKVQGKKVIQEQVSKLMMKRQKELVEKMTQSVMNMNEEH